MIYQFENSESGYDKAMMKFKEYKWDESEANQYWDSEKRKADKTQRYLVNLRSAAKNGITSLALSAVEAQQRAYGWKEERNLADAIDLLEGSENAKVEIEL